MEWDFRCSFPEPARAWIIHTCLWGGQLSWCTPAQSRGSSGGISLPKEWSSIGIGGISVPGSVQQMSRSGSFSGHGGIQAKLGLGGLNDSMESVIISLSSLFFPVGWAAPIPSVTAPHSMDMGSTWGSSPAPGSRTFHLPWEWGESRAPSRPCGLQIWGWPARRSF